MIDYSDRLTLAAALRAAGIEPPSDTSVTPTESVPVPLAETAPLPALIDQTLDAMAVMR
ncbi:hypothetical protein [Sphingobium phenoxybenzoativorans]|uniref:hypothetical protein n=1 Tax=Sphingobium phenoxybenzoativorans TaxID=1592790 RepID=UPI0014954613|nr:hypothetical protein [Sphingobium phenoxybenzoativorans]